jgi:hypothetical protein
MDTTLTIGPDDDPQRVLDDAPASATVAAAPAEHALESTLVVRTPGLTVRGLGLRVADGADVDAVRVTADRVTLSGVEVDGNRGNQPGDRESSGVVVTGTTGVRIVGGRVVEPARHGVRVVGVDEQALDRMTDHLAVPLSTATTADTAVRDVTVERPQRDGVSVEGTGVRNVLVEGVTTLDSSDRGCVEVKDGASDAVVRDCYAEDCQYVCAAQDHGLYGPSDVAFANNRAVGCAKLVTTQGGVRHGPLVAAGNVGRDLTGAEVGGAPPGAVAVGGTDGVVVANNSVDGADGPGVVVADCTAASVTGNVVREVEGDGLGLVGSPGGLVGGNHVVGAGGDGIVVDGDAADCRCTGNRTAGAAGAGIRVGAADAASGDADGGAQDRPRTPEAYLVTDNVVRDAGGIVDEGRGGLVTDNLVDGEPL